MKNKLLVCVRPDISAAQAEQIMTQLKSELPDAHIVLVPSYGITVYPVREDWAQFGDDTDDPLEEIQPQQ